MTDIAAPGLREQKRIATKRALQLALLRLAIERGFDAVTVEEVAQTAQVSTRTFFNYFATKEEALTAPHGPIELSADEIARYDEGAGDPLTDLVVLMAGRASGDEDRELHRLRRDLMQRESRLFGDRATDIQRIREQIVALVEERLRADELRAGRMPDEPALQERAAYVALLAISIARHGWSTWAAGSGATSLSDSVLAALDGFRDIAAATG